MRFYSEVLLINLCYSTYKLPALLQAGSNFVPDIQVFWDLLDMLQESEHIESDNLDEDIDEIFIKVWILFIVFMPQVWR